MSTLLGDARVRIRPDTSGFQREANAAIIPGVKKIAAGIAGVFAAAKLADIVKDSIGAASDLNESQTKIVAIFGKSTAAITKQSKGAAKALGLTEQQVLDANATFGVFGKSAGLAGQPLVDFTSKLTALAPDLASFYNADPSEVIDAIGSAMRGEAEPMRRFGVLLDDATLRQQALKMGLISTTKTALTPQNKVLAAQALIMDKTKIAQGDFQRTSGGLANQQRILAAQWGNMKVSLGQVFLPLMVKLATFANDKVVPAVQNLGTKLADFYTQNKPALKDLGDKIKNALGWLADHKDELMAALAGIAAGFAALKIGSVISNLVGLVRGLGGLRLALLGLTTPVGLVALAVAALVGGFIYAYKHSETFRDIVNKAWASVSAKVKEAWETVIKPALDRFKTFILDTVIPAIVSFWKGTIVPAFDSIMAKVREVWPRIQGIIALFSAFIRDILIPIIKTLVNNVAVPLFKLLGATVWAMWTTTVWPALKAFGDIVKWLLQKVIGPMLDLIVRAFIRMARNIVTAAADAFGWVPGIGPKLKAAKKHMDQFALDANRAIDKIEGKNIDVGVRFNNVASFKTSGSAALQNTKNKLNAMNFRADGGPIIGPGSGTSDSIPAMLSNGEHVLTAKEVKKAGGHGAIMAWRQGLRAYADGGPVLRGPNIRVGTPTYKQMLAANASVVNALAQKVSPQLYQQTIGAFTGMAGSGVQRWLPTVLQALAMTGQPASMAQTLLRRMNQESGGNPRAINLWDSNARAGHPSKGLLQTIDPTFQAYRLRSLPNDVYNPLSNIVASIRYTLARYGSLPAGYNRAGGYARGTLSASPGLHWVGENGPELLDFRGGERVHSARQSAAMTSAAPLINGDLVIQSKDGNVREDLNEALFQLRRIRRGGVHA